MGYLSKVPATVVQTALHVIAIAAFVTLALTPHRTAGYLLALAGLLVVAGRGSETGLLNAIPAVTLLAAAVLVPLPHTATTSFIALALVYLIVSQSALLALGRKARTQTLNLPGYAEPRRLAIPADAMAAANVIMVAAVGAIGYAKWPVWPVAAAVAAECAAVAIVTANAMYRRFKGASDVSHFRAALEKHAPSFIVYFSATAGQELQLLSWLPELDSIGEPYLVVVREAATMRKLRPHVTAPLFYCPTVPTVDSTIIDTVRAVIYVNNANLNSHIARFSKLTHIQLLHGDSDKPASFNPVSAMFDRLFVAGPAGVQRYADHGVVIAEEKFDIVGRPQAAAVTDTRTESGTTVLYALTTPGHYADENHCSLPAAEAIVRGLIDAGATVILRPHPSINRRTRGFAQLARAEKLLADDRARSGRPHLFGAAADAMSAVEAMNASDAMVSDVSAMAVDYLASGKPLALTDVRSAGPDFARHSPIAHAAYVISADGANTAEMAADMLGDDSNAGHRAAVRDYYLAADTFAETTRRYLRGEKVARTSTPVHPRESADVTV